MKITKVTYQKTYSIGPYLTDRVGFEAEPEGNPGDAPMDMLTMLEELADEWHKKQHPHLYQEEGIKFEYPTARPNPPVPPVIDYGKHDASPEGVLADIEKCQTLDELKSYKLLAAADKTTYSVYCKRLKELSI